MVFQDYALFPHMTVAHNVGYGLWSGGDAHRIDEVLDLVGLHQHRDRMPHELSGGEQQRVALARALAPRPASILLDEPFSNLDAGLRDRMRREVRRILKDAGTTAVVVTHDQEEALATSDVVAIMRRGHVVQTDTPERLYRAPQEDVVIMPLNNISAENLAGWVGRELRRRLAERFPDVKVLHLGCSVEETAGQRGVYDYRADDAP